MLPVMLLISILMGLIPLAGIAWILTAKSVTTVDGLFMSLILLTISAVFFLNVLLELRSHGILGKKKAPTSKSPPSADVG